MNTWVAAMLEAYLAHGMRQRDDGRVELKCPGEIEAYLYANGGAGDAFDNLGNLEFEALLVTGAESNIKPLVELHRQGIPNANMHVVADASHFVPQEKPDEVAALIQDWFAT